LTQVSFLRHGAFFGPEDAEKKTLCLIGAGATGSWTALLAAKMGWHDFVIWDLDVVESHNLPNQAYDMEHLGQKKVFALEQVLKRFNPNVSVKAYDYFFDASNPDHVSELSDYVFIAVDSLDTRKAIYESIKLHPFVDLVFETRMGFTHAELNIVNSSDTLKIDEIISMLKTDEEVTEAACNERIITSLVTIVSSALVHNLCYHASSHRTQNEFTNYGKTLFTLDPKLNTYQMKGSLGR
jgi:molybdopterin/thiamine biosynthesis adenylyltransferase